MAETYAEAADAHTTNASSVARSSDDLPPFRPSSHEQAELSRMPDSDDAIFSSFMKTLDFVDPSEYPFGMSRSLHASATWASVNHFPLPWKCLYCLVYSMSHRFCHRAVWILDPMTVCAYATETLCTECRMRSNTISSKSHGSFRTARLPFSMASFRQTPVPAHQSVPAVQSNRLSGPRSVDGTSLRRLSSAHAGNRGHTCQQLSTLGSTVPPSPRHGASASPTPDCPPSGLSVMLAVPCRMNEQPDPEVVSTPNWLQQDLAMLSAPEEEGSAVNLQLQSYSSPGDWTGVARSASAQARVPTSAAWNRVSSRDMTGIRLHNGQFSARLWFHAGVGKHGILARFRCEQCRGVHTCASSSRFISSL